MRSRQHHRPRDGGCHLIPTEYPNQFEGKLDGAARPLTGDKAMILVPDYPLM